MTRRVLIGMLTPSSNTVLEPTATAMVAGLPEVSVHFSRFRVTEIALTGGALDQFALDQMLGAARLLADARVDVIAWNGTSAGWLGFEADERLCAAISQETGIPATTSVLALNEIMHRTGVARFGLVTPYAADVQARIAANYAAAGLACTAEQHLDLRDNFSFSEVPGTRLAAMVREVAAARPDCVATFCTNLRAAPLVEALERETGTPVHDTVSAAVWKALALAGVDPARVTGWGQMFRTPP